MLAFRLKALAFSARCSSTTIPPDSMWPSVTAIIFDSTGMAIDDTGKAAKPEVYRGAREAHFMSR
jgi:cell division protein FtsI/penicillin-binding protein 2